MDPKKTQQKTWRLETTIQSIPLWVEKIQVEIENSKKDFKY